jgi:hypothetical protein
LILKQLLDEFRTKKPTSVGRWTKPNLVQDTLLPSSMARLAKGCIAFLVTLVLSRGTAAALRRIPAVARVI